MSFTSLIADEETLKELIEKEMDKSSSSEEEEVISVIAVGES